MANGPVQKYRSPVLGNDRSRLVVQGRYSIDHVDSTPRHNDTLIEQVTDLIR
jgi:hypothetical protein